MFGNQSKAQRTWNARRLWVQQRVLVGLLGCALTLPASSAFAQDESPSGEDALQATALTVNVELIHDASGCTAKVSLGTEGQLRMDAAQAAMRDVIVSTPGTRGPERWIARPRARGDQQRG